MNESVLEIAVSPRNVPYKRLVLQPSLSPCLLTDKSWNFSNASTSIGSVAGTSFSHYIVMQDDGAQSLQARADLMVAEAEEEGSKSTDILHPASQKEYKSQMPQRAFFSMQVGTIYYICLML